MGGLLDMGKKLANPAAMLGLPDPVGDALGINDKEKKNETKEKARKSALAEAPKKTALTKLT